MASALKSQFGSGSSSGGGDPFGLGSGRAPSHSHHNILHNLLEDAVNTAKGIPFGLVMTAEHPIRSVKAMGHSYAETYGHGFGHFLHEFHDHPLQPLLDAISVPLVLAGGVGFAVKGASAAAELGHVAEAAGTISLAERANALAHAGDWAGKDALIADASRYPGLKRAAQHFEKNTQHTIREIDSGAGFTIPYAYSSNMFRRFLTQGTDSVLEGLVGKKVEFFSTKGKGARLLDKNKQLREAAAAGRAFGQGGAIHAASKLKDEAGNYKVLPQELGEAIRKDFVDLIMGTGHKVHISKAVNLDTLGPNAREWQYVAKEADTPASTTVQQEHFIGQERGPAEHRKAQFVHQEFKRGGVAEKPRTLESFDDEHARPFVENLGKSLRYTTDPAEAALDEHGMATIVRKGTAEGLANDVSGAMELAKKVYYAPLKVWKAMILGQSPRYLVNNVIGNAGMYALSTNPVEGTRGFFAAIRSVRGIKAARRMELQAHNDLAAIMAKHLPDDFIDRQFGYLYHGALSLGKTLETSRNPWGKHRLLTPMYGVTEKIAYRGFQRSSIMGAMSSLPGFRKLMRAYMKEQGLDSAAAFQKASRTMLKDPRTRATIEKRVTDWAGQYYHLNSLEQGLTALVPFYNWTRHALRFGKEQVLSRPVSSMVLASMGAMGDKESQKEMGKVPDFLKGAIPVHGAAGGILGLLFGQSMKGRQKIILTSGYNPLGSAADDARAIAALAGGGHAREAIGGQINPLVSGLIGGVTGEKLFSGAKDENRFGPLGSALEGTLAGPPQVTLARTLAGELGIPGGTTPRTKTAKGKDTLYTHDVRSQLSSILGLNERDFSTSAARALYKEEHPPGKRKSRRKGRKAASALKSQL